jgi:alpha-beta hydrolase superfamily lysophospholipase
MIAWWKIRRYRDEVLDDSDAAEMCMTAAIWAWTRAEDRRRWAMRVIELSKGAGAPRSILWGEESPMPGQVWWQERAARFAERAAATRRRVAILDRARRRLRKRRTSMMSGS